MGDLICNMCHKFSRQGRFLDVETGIAVNEVYAAIAEVCARASMRAR